MTNDEAFLKAILDNPKDPTARLVYADWLEERGDPRANALRTYPEVARIVAGLKDSSRVPQDRIDRHAKAGRIDFLAGLAMVLDGCLTILRNRRWPGIVAATVEYVERVLAVTPGVGCVEALLAREPTRMKATRLASMLSAYQSREVLLAVFERHAATWDHSELLPCLAQEMVIRAGDLDGVPALITLAGRLRARSHPLADLPLRLLALEVGLGRWLPRYGSRVSGVGMASGEAVDEPTALPTGSGLPPFSISDLSEPAESARIAMAVEKWLQESNGMVESRVLRLDKPVTTDHLSVVLLLGLGLECLRGATVADVRASRITARHALEMLFSAASTGGAYGGGREGAYGRLASWQSLAGLAGTPWTRIEEVARAAERCVWVSFDADTAWFRVSAWDYGLMSVRPDGRSLGIFAVTDTD